jgi:hypothetical protein
MLRSHIHADEVGEVARQAVHVHLQGGSFVVPGVV